MKTDRRKFLAATAALTFNASGLASAGAFTSVASANLTTAVGDDRLDPFVEVIPAAIISNVKTLHRLSGNRPVLAVVKNNGYGLGVDTVAKILEPLPEVAGFAAVKVDECVALRDAGIKKPVLHLGMASENDSYMLATRDVQLSVYDTSITTMLEGIARKIKRPVASQCYIDTGMCRMGIPYYRAANWLEELVARKLASFEGTFTELAEDPDFDKEQGRRLVELNTALRSKGVNTGKLHAVSSHGIYHCKDAHLDLVRPGIALYGAYPADAEEEKKIAPLSVAFRLAAHVVRMEQLRPGDTVSYGRHYTAKENVWIATVSAGHADGYLREAVKGARVLVNGEMYPVIGAVSASHTILEIGREPKAKIGDRAILVGPDHPEIHPNQLATITGVSVYDILMHLSARLPKVVV
jgi:alanine racemase